MIGLGDVQDAKNIYENLCKSRRPDWWLLHEYGNLLKKEGEIEKALLALCTAALSNIKLEMMVKLFSDLAIIFMEMGESEKARAHCHLEKFVRDDNDWPISVTLSALTKKLDSELLDNPAPLSKQEALSACRTVWKEICGIDPIKNRIKKKGLVGKIAIPDNKSFCFINTKDGLSAICFSKDIPADMTNGETVIFDAISSFDKKKNRDSWKAIKVRRFNKTNN